jgi:glycosyltransferase involved in cell wall biosynthesis
MNILVLTPDIPSFTTSAGTKRLAHILEAMFPSHSVTCGVIGISNLVGVKDIFVEDIQYVSILSVSAFIKHILVQKYDVILFEYWRTAHQFGWTSRIFSPRSVIVVDCVDLEYIRLSRSSAYSDDHVQHTRHDETKLIQYCDAVICVSAVEANIVKTEMFVPEEYVTTFSVIYDRINLDRRPTRGTLLFVGNGGHSPNLDAMTWFCNEVMPRVNSAVRLRLVGANWPDSLNVKNVDVIGFVDDLHEEYATCSYVVSPIRFGSGVNGKVAEAYCYGVPMVMSSLAADGCGIASGDGITILSTENAIEWVQAIDRLVACDRYAAITISENVADQFSYATNANRILEFINRLKAVRASKSRRWYSTVSYALNFVGAHIRHLVRQK